MSNPFGISTLSLHMDKDCRLVGASIRSLSDLNGNLFHPRPGFGCSTGKHPLHTHLSGG